MLPTGPARWGGDDELNRAIYLRDKSITGACTALVVPTHGRLQFCKGGRVDVQRLSGHCGELRFGGALPPTE